MEFGYREILEITLALISIAITIFYSEKNRRLSKDRNFIGDSAYSLFRACLTISDKQKEALDNNEMEMVHETRRGMAELSRHGASMIMNFLRTYVGRDPNFISKEEILRIGRNLDEVN